MATYQWTTSTPRQGGPVADLALALAPGKVLAVVQAGRASLELHQWTQSAGPPTLTPAGSVALGAGSLPTVVPIAPDDAALAYRGTGAGGHRLAWLQMAAATIASDSVGSPAGGRASIAGFTLGTAAPKPSASRAPARGGPSVNVGPAGKPVVTAYNLTSAPSTMRLTFWNVPYQTITSLQEPTSYDSVASSAERRPSVVGLRATVDGIALRSAEALVASADAGDHLRLRRYHLEIPESGPKTLVVAGETHTTEVVQDIEALAIPIRGRLVVVTAVVTPANQMKLIAWRLAASGAPQLWFEHLAGPAQHVRMVRVRSGDFATGIVAPSGKASTRYWRLPAQSAPAPQFQQLAATGSVSNVKAIRLVHRVGRGTALGTTFVASHRQDGTFLLHAYQLTDA
jgi:hypothetical protein